MLEENPLVASLAASRDRCLRMKDWSHQFRVPHPSTGDAGQDSENWSHPPASG